MSTIAISQPLKDYQIWYNENVSAYFKAPKCQCGGTMLWSVAVCEQCATPLDIQQEIEIIEWHLENDITYKK